DIRRGQPVQRDPERPGNSGEDAGEEECDQPVTPDLEADELGPRLVVANGLERLPEWRVDDEPHHRNAEREHGKHVEVIPMGEEVGLVLVPGRDPQELRRRDAEAVGAARDPEELEGQAPQHLGQRQRQDGKEDARVADAGVSEERGHHDGCGDGAGDEQLHRFDLPVPDHERHCIGANAEVRGVAEGEEAGVAQEEIETESGDGHDQAVGEQDGLIRVYDPGEKNEQHQDRDCPGHRLHWRAPVGRSGHGAHAFFPKSPAGRTSSTIAAMRYSTASSISGNKLTPISRMVPTSSAPTKAPTRPPRPPATTTMNERTSASPPIPSTADWLGTMMAPPSPAMKQPMVKAST